MVTKVQLYWLAAMGWTTLISWFSINPVSGSGVSGTLMRTIPDFILHFSAYIILTALLFLALQGIHFEHALPAAIIFAISLGTVLELLQFTIPYRMPSLLDVSMNSMGAVLTGYVLYPRSKRNFYKDS